MRKITFSNTEDLPGYKKKSFILPYNGGEIWFEHLDGIYDNESLVLKKLEADKSSFAKPSSTSFICFVFDETTVTERILTAVCDSILKSSKRFMKVAFSGLDKMSRSKLRKALTDKGFGLGCFDGLEDAKEWLLP